MTVETQVTDNSIALLPVVPIMPVNVFDVYWLWLWFKRELSQGS